MRWRLCAITFLSAVPLFDFRGASNCFAAPSTTRVAAPLAPAASAAQQPAVPVPPAPAASAAQQPAVPPNPVYAAPAGQPSGLSATDWTTIGMFWVTVAMFALTVVATAINWLLFRSQIDPDVIVYVTPDEQRASLILLIVENIGKSMAYDVEFHPSRPLPERAWGLEPNAPMPAAMQEGPLITGIPALGPGAKRVITWGQYGGLFKALGNDTVQVTVNFKSKRAWTTSAHSNVCPLDIHSFAGTDAADNNWAKKIAESLHEIAKSLRK